jgi:predicted CoA-binding protein
MPARAAIDRFLELDRIAFVGVSRDSKQFANAVYRALRDGDRTVVPIHPSETTVEGDPAVRSLADAPAVDGVIVMLPKTAVDGVVDEALDAGIEHVWLHAGLGSSCVTEGAVARCRSAGVDVVDGACPLMFLEPVRGIHRLHRVLTTRIR